MKPPLSPTSDVRAWLEDAGVPLTHSARERVTLSDIYLYPDLGEQRHDTDLRRARRTVGSADVFGFICAARRVTIAAPPQSGKTALAKRLYSDFLARGLVPVYLNGAQDALRPADSADGVPPLVLRRAARQYGDEVLERYRQLAPERRVIIIDNVDKLELNLNTATALLTDLGRFADYVVVLGDDIAGRVAELATATNGGPGGFASYEIRPFRHGLRERFAQQWFALSTDPTRPEAEVPRQLEQVSRTLDTIIGRNYVPAYPVYILSVLQAVEVGSTVDMRASTHGYFYEIFIRTALAGGGTKVDFDIRLAFLAYLAYDLFETERAELSLDQLEAVFNRYQAQYDVGRVTYAALRDALVARGMLVQDGDRVRFRYPYLFYYFVASYFRDRMSDARIRDHIERLSRRLHITEAANVLLFLAHLSKDPVIIAHLSTSAATVYADVEPATLAGDTVFADVAREVLPALAYVENDPAEARRERADAQDDAENREASGAADGSGSDTEVGEPARADREQFDAALETLRILGQILKNFPGSLEADTKLQIAQAAYGIGLRTLTVVLRDIKAQRATVIEAFTDALRRAYPKLPEQKLKLRAEHMVAALAIVTAHGLVRYTAFAVGAPELDRTFAKVLTASPTPATRLVDVGLRLDLAAVFPSTLVEDLAAEFRDLPLAAVLLRLLVIEHFEQFAVDRNERQRVCAKLGISYKQLQSIAGRQKMLSA